LIELHTPYRPISAQVRSRLELRFEVRVLGEAASSVAALKARRRNATTPGVQVATLDLNQEEGGR
jgi:hypothetical protein